MTPDIVIRVFAVAPVLLSLAVGWYFIHRRRIRRGFFAGVGVIFSVPLIVILLFNLQTEWCIRNPSPDALKYGADYVRFVCTEANGFIGVGLFMVFPIWLIVSIILISILALIYTAIRRFTDKSKSVETASQ